MTTVLHADMDAWLVEHTGALPPPWYARGEVVAATETERWAAAMLAGFWNGHHGAAPLVPPALASFPADCTPFGRVLIRLAAIIYEEPHWKAAFEQRSRLLDDSVIITPDHRGMEGLWPAHGAVSAEWDTVFNDYESRLHWPWSPAPPPAPVPAPPP